MARRRPANTHGLAVVDKPAGVTSHDVVGILKLGDGNEVSCEPVVGLAMWV